MILPVFYSKSCTCVIVVSVTVATNVILLLWLEWEVVVIPNVAISNIVLVECRVFRRTPPRHGATFWGFMKTYYM